jgi:hypothetical protein
MTPFAVGRLSLNRWRKCKNSLRRMNSAPNFFARAAAAPPVRICLVQEHGGGAASQPRGLPGGVHPPSVRLSAAVEEAVFSHDCGAVLEMSNTDQVTEDPSEVSLGSAEIGPELVSLMYASLAGDPVHQKSMRDSLSKMCESEVRYHAYCKVSSTQHLIISTQEASLAKEKRAKKNEEKTKPKRHLTIVELLITPSSTAFAHALRWSHGASPLRLSTRRAQDPLWAR